MITEIPIIDRVLDRHAADLREDFTAYRNHAYRVVNLCLALSPSGSTDVEKIGLAAAFHDLGIWTDHTFDYLAPSVRLASAHLIATGHEGWSTEITQMILEHHKLSPFRGSGLVEQFRCADWVDVSRGLFRCGLSRQCVNQVLSTWPD